MKKLTFITASLFLFVSQSKATDCPPLVRAVAARFKSAADAERFSSTRRTFQVAREFRLPIGTGPNSSTLALSPDGKTMYLGFIDFHHVFFDLQTHELTRTPSQGIERREGFNVRSVVFLNDGNQMIMAHSGTYPEIREVHSQRATYFFETSGHSFDFKYSGALSAQALVVSPNQKLVLISDISGKASLWNLENRLQLGTFLGKRGLDETIPLRAEFSLDSKRFLLVRDKFESLELYNSLDGALVGSVAQSSDVRLLSYSKKKVEAAVPDVDGKVIYVGLESGEIVRVAGEDQQFLGTLKNPAYRQSRAHDGPVRILKLAQGGNLLISTSLNALSIWNIHTGELVRSFYGSYDFLKGSMQSAISNVVVGKDGSSVFIKYGDAVAELKL